MVNIGLFGAGRIGEMQANILAGCDDANILYVCDVYRPNAEKVAAKAGARPVQDADSILNDPKVDAVVISTTTDMHAELIIRSAKAGKKIYCEKPIATCLHDAYECRKVVEETKVLFQIGLNRRFDPNILEMRKAVEDGKIGNLEMIVISSRDFETRGIEYFSKCGGIFRDVSIHDLDMVRNFLQAHDDDVKSVFASGSLLFNPPLPNSTEYDTSMVQIRSKKGVLCHINNTRRTAYGYDQRVEIFGSEGMVVSSNVPKNGVKYFTSEYTDASAPFIYDYIERYPAAFRNQMHRFVDACEGKGNVAVTLDDGIKAMQLADAATKSADEGMPVELDF